MPANHLDVNLQFPAEFRCHPGSVKPRDSIGAISECDSGHITSSVVSYSYPPGSQHLSPVSPARDVVSSVADSPAPRPDFKPSWLHSFLTVQ